MGQPLRKPATIFTYADYCRWPDDERWELIEGVAYFYFVRTHVTIR